VKFEMSIRPELSQQIVARIKAYVDTTIEPFNHQRIVDALGVLPLCCDWAGCHAIRPDGEIIVFLTDHPDEWRIEDDPRLRNTAIYQGSLKYPELKELIPIRPPDAQVCSNCQGTGTDPMALQLKSDHIICFCGGLGWIP
jgi:hypothetical protein